MEKICTQCKQSLPISEFYKNYSVCKKCKKEYKRQYYLKNKEYVDNKNKEYSLKSKDQLKTYRKNWAKQRVENGTNKKWRLAKKLKAIRLIHPDHKCECVDCQEPNIYLLEFHHTDSNTKENTWNQLAQKPWAMIEPEIMKCIPLCKNCHCQRHSDVDFFISNVEEIESIIKKL